MFQTFNVCQNCGYYERIPSTSLSIGENCMELQIYCKCNSTNLDVTLDKDNGILGIKEDVIE